MHRRVASALLLESIPLTPASALDKREIAAAILRPSDVAYEPGDDIAHAQKKPGQKVNLDRRGIGGNQFRRIAVKAPRPLDTAIDQRQRKEREQRRERQDA